jgi:hypothetical protein
MLISNLQRAELASYRLARRDNGIVQFRVRAGVGGLLYRLGDRRRFLDWSAALGRVYWNGELDRLVCLFADVHFLPSFFRLISTSASRPRRSRDPTILTN